MRISDVEIIHKAINKFYDKKEYDYYNRIRNKKFIPLAKNFNMLANMLKEQDVKIISMQEYKVLIWRVYNSKSTLLELLKHEPSNEDFDKDFYKEKWKDIDELRSVLITHTSE